MRQSGFYWVKMYELAEWIVAEYSDDEEHGGWYFTAVDECYLDSELFKIDERQILRQ